MESLSCGSLCPIARAPVDGSWQLLLRSRFRCMPYSACGSLGSRAWGGHLLSPTRDFSGYPNLPAHRCHGGWGALAPSRRTTPVAAVPGGWLEWR